MSGFILKRAGIAAAAEAIALLALLFCQDAQGQQKRYAVAGFSVCHLREAPDYMAELGTQALMGTIVEIIGEEGYWRQVLTPEPYKAWCTDMGLEEMSADEIEAYRLAPKYICTAWHSAVYSRPMRKSGMRASGGKVSCEVAATTYKIADLVQGDILRMVCPENRKSVRKNGFAAVLLPDGTEGYVPAHDVEDYGKWTASRVASPENVIYEAMKFIGVPYLWGGASPNGVDCSGLTRLAFMMNGIALPRNASQQANGGETVVLDFDADAFPFTERPLADSEGFREEMLRRISRLRTGDLVFFGTPGKDGQKDKVTHVGIYIGEGRFIHASQIVRINSLIPGEPDYYNNSHKLFKARRYAVSGSLRR